MIGILGDPLSPKYIGWLMGGLRITLALSLASCAAATLLGSVVAGVRMSKAVILKWPARIFIAIFRNTPLLVQLFFWYFAAPTFMPERIMNWLNGSPTIPVWHSTSVAFPPFEYLVGFVGLTLFASAFIAEEIRAGMLAVSRNQVQAAQALGMTIFQVNRYVVVPQAIRAVLPPLLGQYMNVVKSSSLTMAVGVVELSYAARQVETETFKTFQAFAIATALYVITIVLIETFGQCLERSRIYRRGRA